MNELEEASNNSRYYVLFYSVYVHEIREERKIREIEVNVFDRVAEESIT